MTAIHPSAVIGAGTKLGEFVAIAEGASIGDNCVIGHHAVIGPRARIGAGSQLGSGCVIHADTILGSQVVVYDNAVLGREPRGVASMTRPPRAALPALVIGDGCVIGGCAVLYRGVTIGARTLVGDLASIREECEIGEGCIIARSVTVNYGTRIGNRVKIMDNAHITGKMVIEDGVFISVLVATTNDNTMDRCQQGDSAFSGPVIRRGASVGAGASILPGVEIGEYAMVASGAYVNRSVPPRMFVAGHPAQVISQVPSAYLPREARPSGETGQGVKR